jgi:hypothetical protein
VLIIGRAFGSLAEKVADYEVLLRELSSRVGEDDADLIRGLLEKVPVACTVSLTHISINAT